MESYRNFKSKNIRFKDKNKILRNLKNLSWATKHKNSCKNLSLKFNYVNQSKNCPNI